MGNHMENPPGIILAQEFSYITPANDFKQSYVHPEPGVWRWEMPDKWIEYAKKNNQIIRMHGPVSPQCSKWAKSDDREAEEMLQNMEEYMTELCKRYNGKVKWMDVVNEIVDPKSGDWFGPKPGTDKWENPWTVIGFESYVDEEFGELNPPIYVRRSFEIANELAPDVSFVLNQHGGMEEEAWNRIKATVRFLRANNLRIDGIGWQAHVDAGWELEEGNIDKLRELIDWAHENELDFHVTENDVFLRNENVGKFQKQAKTFKAIIDVVIEKRHSGNVSWNAWTLTDKHGMHSDRNPALFDNDYKAKPAYYFIQESLENSNN